MPAVLSVFPFLVFAHRVPPSLYYSELKLAKQPGQNFFHLASGSLESKMEEPTVVAIRQGGAGFIATADGAGQVETGQRGLWGRGAGVGDESAVGGCRGVAGGTMKLCRISNPVSRVLVDERGMVESRGPGQNFHQTV